MKHKRTIKKIIILLQGCYPSDVDKLFESKPDKFKKILELLESVGIDKNAQQKKILSELMEIRYGRIYYLSNNNYVYQRNPKPERKDNKNYINYGSGSGGSNNIRYPRKKRKTAWKRFYKLFPKLKPEI